MTLRLLRRLAGGMLGLALVVGAAGCSTYRSDARRAGKVEVQAGSIEGLWVGRWHDEQRPNHGGEIRCVLTRTGDHLYRLSSRSRWWRWFTSSLDTPAVVTPVASGAYQVRGSRHIRGFGDYAIVGRVDGDRFEATYEAAGHRGSIDMRRPAN